MSEMKNVRFSSQFCNSSVETKCLDITDWLKEIHLYTVHSSSMGVYGPHIWILNTNSVGLKKKESQAMCHKYWILGNDRRKGLFF